MKRQLSAFIFAAVITILVNAGHAYGQFGQVIRADIPFEFSVGNKTLPEGTYMIGPVNDSRSIWRLQESDGKASWFLLAGSLSGVGGDRDLQLTFHRYGAKHYLAGFTTDLYKVGLPRSSGEKALRAPGRNILDMGVITIETETIVATSLQPERKEVNNNEKRNK